MNVVSYPGCDIVSTIEGVSITPHRHCACADVLGKKGMCGVIKPTLFTLFLCANPSLLWSHVQNARTSFEDARYRGIRTRVSRAADPAFYHYTTHSITPHIPRFPLRYFTMSFTFSSITSGAAHKDIRNPDNLAPLNTQPTLIRSLTYFPDTLQRSGH